MVVEEFTSFTISFMLNSPPCLLIMGLYHNFGPITSQNLHYYDYSYCSLHRSNDVLWLYFLSYATFCFSWICKCFFFYLFSLLCQLMFNSFHMLFEIYVIWLSVLFSSFPNPSIGPVPLFSWRSPIELVVFLVLLYSCHPGTDLYRSSVFNSLFPGSFAFCSLLVCAFVLLEHV